MLRVHTIRLLERLNDLVKGSGWTSEAIARDAYGEAVHPLDPFARKWCLLGGCQKIAWLEENPVLREERYNAMVNAFARAEPEVAIKGLAIVNDRYGYEDSMLLIDRAVSVQRVLAGNV